MTIAEILTHWIYKPILQWSVLDLAIITVEIAGLILIMNIIKYFIKGVRLFKNNLTKPK